MNTERQFEIIIEEYCDRFYLTKCEYERRHLMNLIIKTDEQMKKMKRWHTWDILKENVTIAVKNI